jgi:hypothetical protein
MRIALAVFVIFAVALLVTIVIASGQEDVLTAMRVIGGDPWGLVTLIDLFCGLFFAALWIGAVEADRRVAIAGIVLLFVLGNLVTAVYLLLRARRASGLGDLLTARRALFGVPAGA